MVPLTDSSQEPRQMDLSQGSGKPGGDSRETPLETSHHGKQDSSNDCPPLTLVPSGEPLGSGEKRMAENSVA